MASRTFYQFLYSKQPKLTMANGLITFGSTGAVSAATGPALSSVTRLGTGIYQIKLVDNYYAYLGSIFNMLSGVTGGAVTDGSFVATTLYQIVTLGTTNWTAVGFDSDYTPAVGGVFVATGIGGSGGGTVKALTPSGILNVEVAQVQSALLTNNNSAQKKGSSIIIQTIDKNDAAANPVSGSQLSYEIFFRDSSVSAL